LQVTKLFCLKDGPFRLSVTSPDGQIEYLENDVVSLPLSTGDISRIERTLAINDIESSTIRVVFEQTTDIRIIMQGVVQIYLRSNNLMQLAAKSLQVLPPMV
jgi:hypothetical protein